MTGYVHSIESMAAVDGPGVRTAIFMQGCPQRCIYCHNPDTWSNEGGEPTEVEDLVKKILRYRPYYRTDGGVTISGGEAFRQIDFVTELLKRLKEEGIHTAVDTCGYFLNDKVKEALKYVDLVLLDIKHTDAEIFEKMTSVPFSHTEKFLAYLKEIQKPMWIRQVIVPGYTDSEEQVKAMLAMLDGAKVEHIDLLPYHTLGVSKWENLGLTYPLDGVEPPEHEVMDKLRELIPEEWR